MLYRTNKIFIDEPNNLSTLDAEASKRLFKGFLSKKPTLEDALYSAGIPKYDLVAEDAMVYADTALDDPEIKKLCLTDDEAGAISCYTLQMPDRTKSPYEIINEGLSVSRNIANLNSIRRLLYLLLSGLRKLPRFRPQAGEMFYRGIKGRVPQNEVEAKGHQFYQKNKTVTWWGFTSTTTDFDTVNTFIEDAPESTLFNIGGADLWGYDIKLFSPFSDEEEILLEPETKLIVSGVVTRGSFSTISVNVMKSDHLVLEDIIPVKIVSHMKMSSEDDKKESVKIKSPQGLKVENSLFKGFELSWNPVNGTAVSYQVGILKIGSKDLEPKIFYEGINLNCCINKLEVGDEYMFKVRCKSGTVFGEWSEKVVKKIEALNVEMAINTLEKCMSDAEGCEDVLKDMVNLMEEKDNQIRAGECECIELVLNVIKTHINNAGVCEQGCSALINITFNINDNQVKAGQCGAIDVVLNAMKTHINNAGVCENGCWALRNITINDDNQVKAGQCGAINVILNVMKTHINNADVCENGCGALWNITINDDNKVKAGESGAIDVILNAMKTHINNAGVCYRGCWTLKNITYKECNRTILKKSNRMEVIKAVQEKYPDLSGTTKIILERMEPQKGFLGLFWK